MLFLSFQSPHNGDDLSEGEGDVGSPDDEMAQKVRNILFVILVLYELFIQTRTSGRSAPLVLVPVTHTEMLVTKPYASPIPIMLVPFPQC